MHVGDIRKTVPKAAVAFPTGGGFPALLMASLSYATLFAASRILRFDDSVGVDAYYLVRISQVATFFVIAFVCRHNLPPVKRLLLFATSLCVLGLAFTGLVGAGLFSDAFSGQVYVFARILSGIGNSCAILVSIHVVCTFGPARSVVAVLGSSVLIEAFFGASSAISQVALLVFQTALLAAGLVLSFAAVHAKKDVPPSADEHPLQFGVAGEGEVSGRPLAFLTDGADWIFQMILAVLIPAIYGFLTQVAKNSGTLSVGESLLGEVVCVATLLTLFAFCLVRHPQINFTWVFVPVVLMYVTALAALPLIWNTHASVAVSLVMCGFVVYKTLLTVLLAQKSFDDPRHTYLYNGVFLGYANVVYGRLAEHLLYGSSSVGTLSVFIFSLVSLWALVVVCLTLFVLQRKGGCSAPAAGDAPAVAAVDPFAHGIDVLSERAKLSPREREVLVEIIHGYTMSSVGDILSISTETVRTHMKRIYEKAGVSNKQALIKLIESVARE